MNHFSTFSEHVTISRTGWYLKGNNLSRIATKLWYVMGHEAHQLSELADIKLTLSGVPTGAERDVISNRLSPKVEKVLRDFSTWYTGELTHGYDKYPAYVLVDLNTGRSLVVTSR